jgi:hypothetical protein
MDLYEKLRVIAKGCYQREYLTEYEWGLVIQVVQERMWERNHVTEDERHIIRQEFEIILQEMIDESRKKLQ